MTHDQITSLIFSNAKPPKKGDRFIPDVNFEKRFEVPRPECKIKPVGDDLPSILAAMERCLSSDQLRPAMCYVYSDGKSLMAVDGYKLVWLNGKYKEGFYNRSDEVKDAQSARVFDSKVPELKMGEVANLSYKPIDWESIVPKREGTDKTKLVMLKDLYSICMGAKRFNDFVNTTVEMAIKIEEAYFNYTILLDAVITLIKLGETDVELQYNGTDRAMCLWGDVASALIMPVMNDKNSLFCTEFKI